MIATYSTIIAKLPVTLNHNHSNEGSANAHISQNYKLTASLQTEVKGHILHAAGLQLGILFHKRLSYEVKGL